jgi:hypothetical protein
MVRDGAACRQKGRNPRDPRRLSRLAPVRSAAPPDTGDPADSAIRWPAQRRRVFRHPRQSPRGDAAYDESHGSAFGTQVEPTPPKTGSGPHPGQPFKEKAMAFPTAVNDQITDSVTQANTKVLGDAPAIAMGNLYQATAQALANAAHNATNAQQQSYVTAQSATTMGVATLYSIDTATTGVATKTILSTKVPGLG